MGKLNKFFYKQKIIDLLELFGILFILIGTYLILYPGSLAATGIIAGKVILIVGIILDISMFIYFIKNTKEK